MSYEQSVYELSCLHGQAIPVGSTIQIGQSVNAVVYTILKVTREHGRFSYLLHGGKKPDQSWYLDLDRTRVITRASLPIAEHGTIIVDWAYWDNVADAAAQIADETGGDYTPDYLNGVSDALKVLIGVHIDGNYWSDGVQQNYPLIVEAIAAAKAAEDEIKPENGVLAR